MAGGGDGVLRNNRVRHLKNEGDASIIRRKEDENGGRRAEAEDTGGDTGKDGTRLMKPRKLMLTIETETDLPLDWFRSLRGGEMTGANEEDRLDYRSFYFEVDQIQVNVVKSKAVKGKPKK